jgi:hypothetical protein
MTARSVVAVAYSKAKELRQLQVANLPQNLQVLVDHPQTQTSALPQSSCRLEPWPTFRLTFLSLIHNKPLTTLSLPSTGN